MQILNADCGSRLRYLAREFRTAARTAGWEAERFKTFAGMLDEIAAELVLEEDAFDINR